LGGELPAEVRSPGLSPERLRLKKTMSTARAMSSSTIIAISPGARRPLSGPVEVCWAVGVRVVDGVEVGVGVAVGVGSGADVETGVGARVGAARMHSPR
jgi:hypothetical protein